MSGEQALSEADREALVTAARLRECLAVLRWSQIELAVALGCNKRLVQRWAAGAPDYPLPESVADWLETLAGFHAQHPPPAPAKWRRRQPASANS